MAWGSVALADARDPAPLENVSTLSDIRAWDRSLGAHVASHGNIAAATLDELPVDAPDWPEALAWCVGPGSDLRHRRLDAHLPPTHWPTPLLQTLERPPRNT